MKLLYHSWDIKEDFTNQVISRISKVPPLDRIFTTSARLDFLSVSKKDIFYREEAVYDVLNIAERNRRDTSSERLLVVTGNQIWPVRNQMDLMLVIMGGMRAFGCALSEYGVAFIMPIRHDDTESMKLDLDYAVELAGHELGGTFVNKDDWEECQDRRCFAYGEVRVNKSGITVPPYGRNHYCNSHLELLVKNAERFRVGELP